MVEGGYNLPEGTEVAVEKVAEAEEGNPAGAEKEASKAKKPGEEAAESDP